MSEDAPVNTGAVRWPDPDSAYFAVRRMQTKLHRWATEEPGRRFGDLFNLVYDPAFLVHAWERVSTNKGARTAGIDKATAAQIETGIGVEAFLGQIRDSLKSGEFRPVEVRQVMIPKSESGKLRQARYSHRRRPGGSGQPEGGARTHLRGGLQAVLVWVPPQPAGAGRDRRDPLSSAPHQDIDWVLEADIKACFDEISHTALMDRLRVRIKDKRICALVKAFLKSGVITELGNREETLTGTPARRNSLPAARQYRPVGAGRPFRPAMAARDGDATGSGRSARRTAKATGDHPLLRRFRPDGVRRPPPRRGAARGGVGRARTRWGYGWHRRRPAWSTSTRASISSASTSAGCGSEGRRSTTSTPTVQEGDPGDQGQGEGEDVQVNPPHGPGRADPRPEQVPGGMGELLPARGVQGRVQRDRLTMRGAG